jgi:hypothetical protein
VAEEGPFDNVVDLVKSVRNSNERIAPHEVVHLLWGLAKTGQVTFRETKSNTPGPATAMLTRIEATPLGFQTLGMPARPVDREVRVSRGPGRARQEAPQRKGDRTDFRTHGPRAEGGPIERRQGVPGATPEPDQVTVLWGHNLPQPDPEPDPEPSVTSDPPPANAAATEPEAWPILQQLRERAAASAAANARADAYLAAAAALEAVDGSRSAELLALADGALEAVALTPLEAEYLSFAERHTK